MSKKGGDQLADDGDQRNEKECPDVWRRRVAVRCRLVRRLVRLNVCGHYSPYMNR